MSIKEYAREMIASDPVFADIANQNETLWVNDKYLPFSMVDAVCQLVVSDEEHVGFEAGKGIKYDYEHIRRKEGKTAKK